MARLLRKGFDQPETVRRFHKGTMEVVEIGEVAVSRFVFEPGWNWERDVRPIVGTETCQHRHLGYTMSGSLFIRMHDGSEITIGPGQAYEIPPGHVGWVVGDEPWVSIEFTSGHSYGASPEELGERTLATILFSDIVDSTAMLERMGDRAWRDVLNDHNVRVREAMDQFRGREMANLGDGFLALFDSPARAVRAARAMTRAVSGLGLKLRVGLHTGEVVISGGQVRGVAVHTAARVSAVAAGDEVLVSSTTCDLLEGSGLEFEDHGEHELKGLRGSRRLFCLAD